MNLKPDKRISEAAGISQGFIRFEGCRHWQTIPNMSVQHAKYPRKRSAKSVLPGLAESDVEATLTAPFDKRRVLCNTLIDAVNDRQSSRIKIVFQGFPKKTKTKTFYFWIQLVSWELSTPDHLTCVGMVYGHIDVKERNRRTTANMEAPKRPGAYIHNRP